MQKKKSIVIIIFFIGLFLTSGSLYADTEKGIIAQNKPWETSFYTITGEISGPLVVIIGGTHGDELAGWKAAERILDFQIKKGKLLLIPYANIKAVHEQKRAIEGEGNLNRCYPGNKDGLAMEQVAFAIFSLIKENKPALVLDLHESLNFHSVEEKRLGQTLIAYPDDTSIWIGLNTIEDINTRISKQRDQFDLLQGPIKGSTAWAVGEYLQIPAITVETCRKLPLETQINYQIQIVKSLIEQIEVELE